MTYVEVNHFLGRRNTLLTGGRHKRADDAEKIWLMRPPLAGRQLAPSPSLPMLDMTRRRPPAAGRPSASGQSRRNAAVWGAAGCPPARVCVCAVAMLGCCAGEGFGPRYALAQDYARRPALCRPGGYNMGFSLLVVGTISLIASRRHVITFHATVEAY